MGRYISSTDELLVENADETPDRPEIAVEPAYQVTFDDDREAVVVESESDDFVGIVEGLGIDDANEIVDYRDEITGATVSMRDFQVSSLGKLAESRARVFPGTLPSIPVSMEYVFDYENHTLSESEGTEYGYIGVRMSTEVGGGVYGFEWMVANDDSPDKLYLNQLDRQMRQLEECIWEDFVVANVTHDEG